VRTVVDFEHVVVVVVVVVVRILCGCRGRERWDGVVKGGLYKSSGTWRVSAIIFVSTLPLTRHAAHLYIFEPPPSTVVGQVSVAAVHHITRLARYSFIASPRIYTRYQVREKTRRVHPLVNPPPKLACIREQFDDTR